MRTLIFAVTVFATAAWTPGALAIQALVESGRVPGHIASEYLETLDALLALTPRADRVASVSGLTIQREVARFTLQDGSLYLLTPVAGRTVGAVFVGTGHVSITPPTAIERAQLQRLYGDSTLQEPFSALVMLFGNRTARALEQGFVFGEGQVEGVAREYVEETLKYLTDRRRRRFHVDLLTSYLNGRDDGLFYAHFGEKKSEPLVFFVNPHEEEEVTIRRRNRNADGDVTEIISQFHASVVGDAESGELSHDQIGIDHYAIESTIAEDLDYTATARMRIRARQADVRWVRLRLYSELAVDSIVSDAGVRVPFERDEESVGLWVRFEPALTQNEVRTIDVHYAGELLRYQSIVPAGMRRRLGLPGGLDRWVFLGSTSTWYPRYGARGSMIELTYHVPDKFTLISVGDSVHGERNGETVTTRWRTPVPTAHASFNLGEFESFDVRDERIPPVSVLLAEKAHDKLRAFLVDNDMFMLEQQDMLEHVTTDITNSLSFFRERYGEPLPRKFYATEIPYSHGQAFPGLLHLSWSTFQWTADRGGDEVFRAHEMAHQWWGIGVEPTSYRDWWLAEGLSEFSGLWYMQTILEDNENYFRFLKDWREDIFDRGNELAPVWLGVRAGISDEPGDYGLVVYRKGAWIFHMLRNLFLDLQTMKEDAFFAMMRDFYETHRGKRASTDDFRRVVERHAGFEFDWFFDQWVRGSAIPTYRVRRAVEETPEGKYAVRLQVTQEGVPADFKMPVPILLDFGANGSVMLRVWVDQPVTQIELPLLDMEPERIVFNPLESVLADVKDDGRIR